MNKKTLFVKKYIEKECLWNVKYSFYKNRVERENGYRRLWVSRQSIQALIHNFLYI
jgi:ribosomal protein L20